MIWKHAEEDYEELQGRVICAIKSHFTEERTTFHFQKDIVINWGDDDFDSNTGVNGAKNVKIYSVNKEYADVGALFWQENIEQPLYEFEVRQLIRMLKALELNQGDWT